MTQELIFWQVDAFANEPFKGNPAAVFVLSQPFSDELMLNIAREMNLAETAFVLLQGAGKNPLLRWFTPQAEIDLCGHATLASAHTYLTQHHPELSSVTFDTRFVGPLLVHREGSRYTMNFPARAGTPLRLDDVPTHVLQALGPFQPIAAFQDRDLMLVYDDDRIVYEMEPNYHLLREHQGFVMVTARSRDPKYDFVSRFFTILDGIPEDPVTGSAHCTAAPYWSRTLNKTSLKAYQASSRGGELELEIQSDRVLISGEAITVFKGQWLPMAPRA